ncbi:MAG: Eco57I restriction-modification methylase domain-containing protein [Fimbriimonadaceae bacterium]|nr:Eco57I restriction-modification methylase domain-containing protein [Fimbriimonadaceae bacterium]
MPTAESHNPDVLLCLANLSSDEVFTPPSLANQVLDLLPPEIWSDPNATFLDPACKTGVFLREIARRLLEGLEGQIPDLQERIDHVMTKQVFGIAITELTALASRRSVYCSKTANGEYSVCTKFSDEEGNIRFRRVEHTWERGKCAFCGASQAAYDRDEALETHAYEFIHCQEPKEIFDMEFDVIVSNPPYQMGSDGGTRDIPIYNQFVDTARKLNPKFLCMIIPSRWMASGLGLSQFRASMLSDRRVRHLVDYERMDQVFPGVDFEGGVCYFLWDRDTEGDCSVTSVGSEGGRTTNRRLDDHDVFVRDPVGVSVLAKVAKRKEPSITEILSVDKEFGWTSNFDEFHSDEMEDDVPIYYFRNGQRRQDWISRDQIHKSTHLIDTWKVMVPQAYGERGAKPAMVLGPSFRVSSPSVCTQTYLFFHTTGEAAAVSVQSYLRSRFLRFLVSLRKITQHATRSTYTWVPMQTWDREWTDEALYKKYGLTKDEIAHIEAVIRPMEPNGE